MELMGQMMTSDHLNLLNINTLKKVLEMPLRPWSDLINLIKSSPGSWPSPEDINFSLIFYLFYLDNYQNK